MTTKDSTETITDAELAEVIRRINEGVDHVPDTYVAIDVPIPYELNSKIHTEEQIGELAKDIADGGLNHSILLDKDNVIISGHGRLLACKKLGWKVVRVKIMSHWTKEQANLKRINDNRTTSNQYDSFLTKMELEAIGLSAEEIKEKIAMDEAEVDNLLVKILDEVDVAALSENIQAEVAEQAKQAERDIDKADLKPANVTKGLGFSKLTVGDNRNVARFIAMLQDKYDIDDPAEAIMRFIIDSIKTGV